MTRQAQVGAFALLALLMLFGVFYVITDFGTRHIGYKTGVHFQSAAGLHAGASVYFSGVGVGSVDSIALLPDNTVDVILAIDRDIDVPRDSQFLIQAPLTGDPNVLIVPPPPGRALASTPLPRDVVPVERQPQGRNSASIADLLDEGQGEVRRLDTMLTSIERSEPRLLATLQTTLDNANTLTSSLNRSMTSIAATMQSSLGIAGHNIAELSDTLNASARIDTKRLDTILTQFQATSLALNASMQSLKSLSSDARLRNNLIDTTKNIAETTRNIAALTGDLRSVTSDTQTQSQIKSTIANLNATMEKANSLLGSLGGTSSVYGVDQNATPAPNATPATPSSSAPRAPNVLPPRPALNVKNRLGGIARNLVAIQLRVSDLSAQRVSGGTPLLTADRGPQTDVNALVFPKASGNVLIGANDIGFNTSANLAYLQSFGSNTRLGGGILYSRLGMLGSYDRSLFGIHGSLYDPRHPTLDLYGDLNVTRMLQLYFGQRDLTHADRRTVFGLQVQVP